MGVLEVALLTIAVLGVEGAPVDEPIQAWQNETANKTTSSSESEGRMTIFAPVTQISRSELDMPDHPKPTYPPVFSPITQVTQLSLEAPQPGSVTWDPSLVIPVVTDTALSKTTFITIAPSAHLERPGSTLIIPGGGETSKPSGEPKYPDTETSRSEVDRPPSETAAEPATTTDNQDGSPGVTSTAHTEISGIELVTPSGGSGGASPTQYENNQSPDSTETNGPGSGDNDEEDNSNDNNNNDNNSNDNDNDSSTSPPSSFLIDNTPITAGGAPITVSGNTISLSPSGSVVINGDSIPMTTSDGHLLPAPTGSNGNGSGNGNNANDDDSTASGDETSSPTRTTGSNPTGTTEDSSSSDGDSDATSTGTNTADAPAAEQTDSAGTAMRALTWPATITMGGGIAFLLAWL